MRAWLQRALFDVVPRDQRDTAAALRRRQVVTVVFVLVGGVVLGLSLRIEPGSPSFYLATLGLAAIVRDTFGDGDALGAQRSRWVVMARSTAALEGLPSSSGWMPLTDDGRAVWTDDFSNVLSALRWR